VLPRDRRLRVVQRQVRRTDLVGGFPRERWKNREAAERFRIARARRIEERLRLFLQLFEVRTCGQLA